MLKARIDNCKALQQQKSCHIAPRLLDSKRDILSGADGKQDWLLRRRTETSSGASQPSAVVAVKNLSSRLRDHGDVAAKI